MSEDSWKVAQAAAADEKRLEMLVGLVKSIRAQDAVASVEADRQKIGALIRNAKGGHGAVNACIHSTILGLMLAMVVKAKQDSSSVKLLLDQGAPVDTLLQNRSSLVWALHGEYSHG
jgi:hypothetical protein